MNFLRLTLISICIASVCSLESQAINIKCGTKDITRPLVKNGDRTLKGEWPFIVALYKFKQPEPFCGGTLISIKHVLTASHCCRPKYTSNNLLPGAVEVYIGAHNLTANESIVKRNVSEIYVHPEWKVYDDRYDADIAILVLSESVNFTNHIRPICMPADDDIIDGATIDTKGIIVGWGAAENENMEQIPRQTLTKALNNSYCFLTGSGTEKMSSARTFCGGEGQGVPNQGDSGGGFFVDSGSAWVQYGIVSATGTNSTGHVTVNSFAVYTNVKLFKQWIVDILSQSGVEVGEAIRMEKIVLNCDYSVAGDIDSPIYACFIDGMDLQSENTEVASFTGSHKYRLTDENVSGIIFRNGTTLHIPSGIGKIFKNLKYFEFVEFTLKAKLIQRSNFRNLEGLKTLLIGENDVESLAEDSFWDLPQLDACSLFDSKINEIKERTFERNGKLKTVLIYSNMMKFIPSKLFYNNSLLNTVGVGKTLVDRIDEKLFTTNLKLSAVHLPGNQLKLIPGNLFEKNGLLKHAFLNNNQLESLPVNLFRNNFLLDIVSLANNALKTIDEASFVWNVKLREVYIDGNHLEFLPEKLFQNNILLVKIYLTRNYLKIIDVNFTLLKNIKTVVIAVNPCIDGLYDVSEKPILYPSSFTNLTEFQNIVRANCSSVNL